MRIVCVCFLAACAVTTSTAQNDWPMYNGNSGRTSYVRSPGHVSIGGGFIPHGFPVESCGAISISGPTVFIASLDRTPNIVASYSGDGQRHWLFEVTGSLSGMNFTAPIFENLVYAGGQRGLGLFALHRSTGAVQWSKPMRSLYSRSPIISGDKLYVIGDSLYCLAARTGEVVWKDRLSEQGSVAVDDSQVYAWNDTQTLHAFDKGNGRPQWNVPNTERASLAVDADGLFSIHQGNVVSRNKADGTVIWSCPHPTSKATFSVNALAVTDDRVLCAIWENAEKKGMLYSINKQSGTKQWDHVFPAAGLFTPTVVNDFVFVTCYGDKTVTCLDVRNGNVLHIAAPLATGYFAEQPVFAGSRLFVPASTSVQIFDFFVDTQGVETPGRFGIVACHPQPSAGEITIRYTLATQSKVLLEIYDVFGRRSATLAESTMPQGEHAVVWNAPWNGPGVYFARLSWPGGSVTRPVLRQ